MFPELQVNDADQLDQGRRFKSTSSVKVSMKVLKKFAKI